MLLLVVPIYSVPLVKIPAPSPFFPSRRAELIFSVMVAFSIFAVAPLALYRPPPLPQASLSAAASVRESV